MGIIYLLEYIVWTQSYCIDPLQFSDMSRSKYPTSEINSKQKDSIITLSNTKSKHQLFIPTNSQLYRHTLIIWQSTLPSIHQWKLTLLLLGWWSIFSTMLTLQCVLGWCECNNTVYSDHLNPPTLLVHAQTNVHQPFISDTFRPQHFWWLDIFGWQTRSQPGSDAVQCHCHTYYHTIPTSMWHQACVQGFIPTKLKPHLRNPPKAKIN